MLAYHFGCSVHELGQRLSAQEFCEWQVMFEVEGWAPRARRMRHGEVLAAVVTGAATRRDKAPWRASHFAIADPWAALTQVRRKPTTKEIEAQVRLLNKRITH